MASAESAKQELQQQLVALQQQLAAAHSKAAKAGWAADAAAVEKAQQAAGRANSSSSRQQLQVRQRQHSAWRACTIAPQPTNAAVAKGHRQQSSAARSSASQ